MKNIYIFIAKTFGFTIIGHGYRHRHYTFTFSEAVSWAACYSEGATVYKRGTVFAAKLQG